MQLIFEILLFLIWSAFFIATLLGVWGEPSGKEQKDATSAHPSAASNPMEMANQLW